MPIEIESKTVTALDDATGELRIVKFETDGVNPRRNGILGFSISGSAFSGKIAVERSIDEGSTWEVVDEYSDDYEGVIDDPIEEVLYRLRCSEFTSGTSTIKIFGSN